LYVGSVISETAGSDGAPAAEACIDARA